MNNYILSACAILYAVSLPAASDTFVSDQNNISCTATALGSSDLVVNAQGWKLTAADFIKHGYRPVRLKIENKGDAVVSITDASVQYSPANIEQLASKYKYREFARTFYLMCKRDLIFSASALLSGIVWCFLEQQLVSDISMVTFFLSLLAFVPSNSVWPIYDYLSLRALNKRVARVMDESLHTGPLLITPGKTAEKILLVPGNIQEFALTVFNEDTQTTAAKFYIDCV